MYWELRKSNTSQKKKKMYMVSCDEKGGWEGYTFTYTEFMMIK